MESWTAIFLPIALLLMRISGFVLVVPVFGTPTTPMRVRLGVVLMLTVFFGVVTPPPAMMQAEIPTVQAMLLMARELLCGLALGMAASLVFRSVQVGARFAGRQMGFAIASNVDPTTGEQAAPIGIFFENSFLLLFLLTGGHRLLLWIIYTSFRAFPAGGSPNPTAFVDGIIKAGQTMLMFGLKFSAPVVAAFVVLSFILGVLARVLPEMNILMMSFPLRVGLGLIVAAAIMPALNDFTLEIADYMSHFLTP